MSQLPPFDIEAEEAVLGTLLLGGSACTLDEIPEIRKEHFYSGNHRHVFAAIQDLHAANEPINTVDVASKLVEKGAPRNGSTVDALTDMTRLVPAYGVRQFQSFALTVLHRSLSRDLIEIARKTIATIECGIGDPAPLMAETEQAIHALSQGHGESSLTTMKDAIGKAFKGLLEHSRRVGDAGGATGVPSGFTSLDEFLGGLHPGDLTVVAARPGIGKSAFVMQIAQNVSRAGWGACVFSLEMASEQLAMRALCSEAKVDMKATRFAKLDQSQWSALTAATSTVCSGGPFFIDDSGSTTLPELRSRARKVQRECERVGAKLGVVAVDYLQLVNNKADNREQAIAEVSRTLKGLAKELQVPVIALSQLNRGVESRADRRPMLGDLRESGAIEQDADNVLMLYRDDYYDKASRTPGIMEVGIVKQRSGPTTVQPLGFDAKTVSFYTLDSGAWERWDEVVNPKQEIGQKRGPRRIA